ncbi:MAG: helix-turn-helix transcriptional regulator [Desulfuromonadales bacterium]|nr:helix-turn-helix transcriptional regulator [Desulfuromonadales bacterium]
METKLKEIGERIREVRKGLGLNQGSFGELIGVKGGTVSKYENGESDAGAEAFSVIAKLGNKSLDWLITGEYGAGHQGHGNNREEHPHYVPADDFERRIVGMLRRLPGESRQHLTNMITTAYYDHMESLTAGSGKKDEGNDKS